jgi:hypothetical protein
VVPCYFIYFYFFPFLRVGWAGLGWLAGWLGDAASLVLAPWPTQNPPKKGGKKRRKEVHLLIIKEKWNSSKIYTLCYLTFWHQPNSSKL